MLVLQYSTNQSMTKQSSQCDTSCMAVSGGNTDRKKTCQPQLQTDQEGQLQCTSGFLPNTEQMHVQITSRALYKTCLYKRTLQAKAYKELCCPKPAVMRLVTLVKSQDFV